jgi:nuclear cap-binding protein subunit 2
MIAAEVGQRKIWLIVGGWGHQRIEEEKRQQEQDKLRSQMQYDTYASSFGGLGMAGADLPRGEEPEGRSKRDRSEEDMREEDKRFRGDRDDEE